jgi:hypothetical protein
MVGALLIVDLRREESGTETYFPISAAELHASRNRGNRRQERVKKLPRPRNGRSVEFVE